MKQKLKAIIGGLTLSVAAVALAAGVLSAAEELAEGIEHLDTELHRINAPHNVIEIVHHTEETVFEFVDLIAHNAPLQAIKFEWNHIRTDVREIRTAMLRYNYFNNNVVRQEFWHVWTAYRYLDHELYHGGPFPTSGPGIHRDTL